METSAWCLMEEISRQTGITVSCIQHVIQVYLAASKFYDFLNQYCSNMLKNPTVRGLKNYLSENILKIYLYLVIL